MRKITRTVDITCDFCGQQVANAAQLKLPRHLTSGEKKWVSIRETDICEQCMYRLADAFPTLNEEIDDYWG